MLNIALFVCNSYEENTMVINRKDSHDAIIIDPGCTEGEELDRVVSYIEKNGLKPAAILLTHAHPDHTAGVAALQGKYGIPVYMHPLERPKDSFRSTDIEDGQVLELAGIKLKVIGTPGHTPGGVCYLDSEDKALFSGDTLFAGTIGRTDLEGGDYDHLIVSVMDKLMGLDGDITVYPGHAHSTTIARERTQNPFLQPLNEPEEEVDEKDLTPISISRERS